MNQHRDGPRPDRSDNASREARDAGTSATTPEHANDPRAVTELALTVGGVWAIRSASSAVIFLDLDAQLFLRRYGPGSSPSGYDGRWVSLVQVTSQRGDSGVVRIGERCEYLTDPDSSSNDFQWWIPRTCTQIERVPANLRPVGN